jgi:hypothetical protein
VSKRALGESGALRFSREQAMRGSLKAACFLALVACSGTGGMSHDAAAAGNSADAGSRALGAGGTSGGADAGHAGHAAQKGTTHAADASVLDAGTTPSRADATVVQQPGTLDAGPAADSGSDARAPGAGARHGLRGAFLELSNDRSASFFQSAIEEMAELHMDIAVVQTESYLQQPNFARNPVDRALIRAVLDQAATSGLKVHLGLALPEWGNGDESLASNASFIDGAISASKQSLDMLLQDFAGHAAWSGCYLSVELWTPGSAGQLGQLPRYASEVSQYVKQKGSFAVSISPFISDSAKDDGAATRTAFAALLSASAIDIVALQDGVGARGLSTAKLDANLPYYRAMIDACQSRCEVWANVESFNSDFTTAASWERFLAQMQTLAPLVPSQITYEYTHYLMPSGAGAASATALNKAYRAWLQ